MTDFEFTDATLKLLIDYGWTPGRNIETQHYEEHFVDIQQTASTTIMSFLRSFGGLEINNIVIDPIEAHRITGNMDNDYFESLINQPLCGIGWWNPALLLMSPTGAIYSAFSGDMDLWGTSIGEALDNILVHRKPTKIPVPETFKSTAISLPPFEERNFDIGHNEDWIPTYQTITLKGIDFAMCKVPRGMFKMGRDENARSKPVHDQYISQSYWISVNMITNRQWKQAVTQSSGLITNPYRLESYKDSSQTDLPVVWVDWDKCLEFVTWLGEGCRLLTEPEWEFAIRGPDNLIDPFRGKPVGTSWVGAQDMGGRLWEWTASIFKIYPYDPSDGREDVNISASRAIRNLGFQTSAHSADATGRIGRLSNASYKNIGFRIGMSKLP